MDEDPIMAAPDFIPNSQFQPDGAAPSPTPTGSPNFIPNNQFSPDAPDEKYGSLSQQALTALEQGLSGLTGGTSKIAETKMFHVKPEDIQGRSEANPITSFGFNVAGTGALLAATDGLGLAAPEGASLLSTIGSNAAQGAILAGTNAVSDDKAFGDPNLAASKILSDAGLSALYGGIGGGVGSALLSVPGKGLKGLTNAISDFASKDVTLAPEAFSPLDQIRMGMAKGLQTPEAEKAIADRTVQGLEALHQVTSADDLGALSGKPGSPEIEHFEGAKKAFLKEFGTSDRSTIDPDEVLSFLTNPAAKNSTQQTITFNNYLKSIEGLSGLQLNDAHLSAGLENAQSALKDWTQELAASSQMNPHVDIEYGEPGKARPYSTKFDLPPGETITPNYNEGVTLGSGENTARVPSYGSERSSPFDEPLGFSLDRIQSKIQDFRSEISNLLEKQNSEVPLSSADVKNSIGEASQLGRGIENLKKVGEAIQNKPEPLGAGLGVIASHIPFGPQALTLYSAIRNYAGDGGLYRLGSDIASAHKLLDGTANVLQKVDQKVGDKARLIFTGASAQSRSKHE